MSTHSPRPETAGEARKRRGQRSVAANNHEFLLRVRGYLEAVSWGWPYGAPARFVTVDDARRYAEARGIKPTHPNAWGAVFRRTNSPNHVWECTGYRKSTIPSNHARRVAVWKLTRKEEATQ